MQFNQEKITNFWKRVNKTDACWIWNGYCLSNGYGRLSFAGKLQLAHRVSWLISRGDIPKGKGFHGTCVLHKCDNRKCVRPSHLFLGTQRDNICDAVSKGRWNDVSGESNPKAKLTLAAVRRIREMLGRKTYKELGQMFCVNPSQIACIKLNKTWVIK